MLRIATIAALPLLAFSATPAVQAVPLAAKTLGQDNGLLLTEAQRKTLHWGCVSACEPSPVESKCVTACEAASYKCIDETGPNETPKDTEACQAKVLKLYKETKGLPKKEEKKEPKKEEKKAKLFLQVRNIDDDNAEAAEMARLEAQSDKDMGEDDDETQTDDAEEKSDDEESFVQVSSKKGDGFDGFGTPDPFNQNDDDQVDAGEPNAPDQENPNDDANMVSDDDADDDDSFVQVGSQVAKKGDGFDGFGTPDPFNQNDDDQVDAGEPNAPDQENPNDDANMVSDDDADDDDSFIQVSRNIDDDNAEAAEMARLEAQSDKDMGEDDDESQTDSDEEKSDDESFVQLSRNIDDDNAEAAEMARLEAQSDKDMGEDDDETKSSDDDKSDDESFVQVSSKKGDGFDGFGTPDPFNQNDDDQVDAGEPNAPDQENPNDDANMVSDDDADDDDSFVQVGSKVAKKGDGFDGFGTPDPFNQNDDDQVDAGEPNAPDQENPNDDANMVSDDDADDDDSFIQVSRNIDDDNAEAAEMARLEAQSDKDMGEDDDESKTDGDDEKSDDESFVQLSRNIDDDNAEAAEMARLEAQSDKDMGEDDDETKSSEDDDKSDDESFVQTSSKKGDGFDGFGTPDPFNQNDDDQVDAGEPNAPDQENPNDDANMVSDDDADDDDSFVQVGSKVAKKGDGFDGFGTPDPFNQNDDDQVDAGEPNAPDQENPNDDANMVSDDDADDDDSFVQKVESKRFLSRANATK